MDITQYKNKIASRYIPVDPEQIGLKIIEADYYFTSIKYDGFFAVLEVKKGNAKLYDRSGKEKTITTITNEAKTIKDDIVLAGEICVFKDNKSSNNREVAAALDEPAKYDFRFGVFDVISYKGEDTPVDVKEKISILKKLNLNKKIFVIEQTLVSSRKDIIDFYKNIAGKEEGAVIRSSDGIIYKIKPSITLDLVVLGYALNLGEEEILRELLLGVSKDKGLFQIITKCGNGFSDKDRKDFIKKLKPLSVDSEYTEVSGAKTAFIMIEPKFVIELSCLDVISETSKGTIRKSILHFDKKIGYTLKEQSATISCISPVFERFRDDKNATVIDTGDQQFSFLVDASVSNESTNFKPSTIKLREVYTKTGKGGKAVRKFLGIQTNKESSGQFSPFVVLYTDFSIGRKTPMEQEIFLCASSKEMEKKITELKEENIKKGWEKI